jgi:hypothetical protein
LLPGLWNPFAWPYPVTVYYLLFSGWYAATALAPFGLLLSIGATRRHRALSADLLVLGHGNRLIIREAQATLNPRVFVACS